MPDEVTVISVGTHIEGNGGDVLACKPGASPGTTIVLCYLSQNKVTPFVVHTYIEEPGICIRGEYGWTLEEAIIYYNKRTG
jgi:hypothetical protein